MSQETKTTNEEVQAAEQKDNRVYTLIKKTSKAGKVYYSVMHHKSDGSVSFPNDLFCTVNKSGNISFRKSE